MRFSIFFSGARFFVSSLSTSSCRCSISSGELFLEDMDHLAVLREKIGSLRAEIAEIQEANEQYRRYGRSDTQAQVAHGQRQERLQAIQQELTQLADLGRRVRSVEEMKELHRSRIHPTTKVS
jgi:hypothetical protein